jgi:23S rRNA (guanosine2251-2'-O)-methyltransferase
MKKSFDNKRSSGDSNKKFGSDRSSDSSERKYSSGRSSDSSERKYSAGRSSDSSERKYSAGRSSDSSERKYSAGRSSDSSERKYSAGRSSDSSERKYSSGRSSDSSERKYSSGRSSDSSERKYSSGRSSDSSERKYSSGRSSDSSERKYSSGRSSDSSERKYSAGRSSDSSERKYSSGRSSDSSERKFGNSSSSYSDRKFNNTKSSESDRKFSKKPEFKKDETFFKDHGYEKIESFNSDLVSDNKEDSFDPTKKGPKKDLVYGKHPVAELLNSEKDINKVWVSDTFRSDEIFKKLKEYNIPFSILDKSKLDMIAEEDVNHQGIIAEVTSKNYTDLSELIELSKTKEVFFVVLDKLEDPHNLGAVIRTADAAGVDAIIIPKHHAVGLNGTVAKTSAGALERMKVCRVTNLVQTIEELKEHNVWFVATDMDGTDVYSKANYKGSIAVVLGGEGKGVTKLVKEKCDFSVRIPMKSTLESLNVSVSAALMIYEVYKQRGFN